MKVLKISMLVIFLCGNFFANAQQKYSEIERLS